MIVIKYLKYIKFICILMLITIISNLNSYNRFEKSNQDIIPKNIIFDLGEVLFKPDKFGIACYVGLSKFMLYPLFTGKGFFSIKPLMFDVLDSIDTEHLKNYNLDASTYKDQALPLILKSWLAGIDSCEDLRSKVTDTILKLKSKNYFKNDIEADLIESLINKHLFNPCIFACYMKPIPAGVRILKDCYDTKKHKLYILSNWDPESFPYFFNSKNNEKVFKYFDKNNIVISGNLRSIKPNKKNYKYLLNKHNLNPKDCIFIDNQRANIKAAQECGIVGVSFKDLNYAKLRRKLRELNVIH